MWVPVSILIGKNPQSYFKIKPVVIYLSENPRAFKKQYRNTIPVITVVVYFKTGLKNISSLNWRNTVSTITCYSEHCY